MKKDIRFLKGVGEARAASFRKLGINNVGELLYFFPRGHEDRSQNKNIEDCADGETVCVSAFAATGVREARIRKGLSIYSMEIRDETSSMSVVWHNNKYVKSAFSLGKRYIFYGKVKRKGARLELLNPIYENIGANKYTGKIIPIYPLTSGLSQKIVQSAMETALDYALPVDEYIPEALRKMYKLEEINFSMKNIHLPESFESYSLARHRFVFEELLILQLALFSRRDRSEKTPGMVFSDFKCVRTFTDRLPFPLTNAQKRSINEICLDFKSGTQMNRLIQGDVGSGKTLVAAAAMYIAVKNNTQAVMMAPTEILASQHYETLTQCFEGLGINVVKLTGGMSSKDKKFVYDMIENGLADIVVGTHAVIQEGVIYNNLGLVIADEQHRFGVDQRAKLMAKGNNPHMLIMSATPIPRTLALILYGDLKISIIDELPPGRKPVKTYSVDETYRQRIYAFLDKSIKEGNQAYVVCPLISETENDDLKNAVELSEKLSGIFPRYKIGLIHGKMRPKEKDAVMEEFSKGNINILVSTTVIEVGVNVPKANIMIIENAERFGLSQLHQLRGRVGRGCDQAFCILFSHGKNEVTRKRMKIMCESNDGFYISEEDLKLRGPGDFFGTRQHGLPEMKIANLFEDREILIKAQKCAEDIIKEDINLEMSKHQGIKEKINDLTSKATLLN